jgi:stringent starvation protein B
VAAALKTHLLRAVYDWAVENGFTPHVIVDTKVAGVRVPPGYADESGRIVLNIHPRALHGFSFDDTWLRFSARFGGAAFNIEVPLTAVVAVYAKENGQGISFPPDSGADDDTGGPSESGPDDGAPRRRPSLRVVK